MERCQSPAEWDSLENYYTRKGIASSNLALSVVSINNDATAKHKEGFVGIRRFAHAKRQRVRTKDVLYALAAQYLRMKQNPETSRKKALGRLKYPPYELPRFRP